MPERNSEADLDRAVAGVLAIPLHQFWGLEVVSRGPGAAEIRVPNGPPVQNNAGVVHGGVLYALLDVACYLASLAGLGPGQNVVTVDFCASVLRSVPDARELTIRGELIRAGRTLYFAEGKAFADGTLIATGKVTKSVVDSRASTPQSSAR